MHDEAERDRKRGDGDFRNRRIEEPSLTIRTQLPEDEERERQEQAKATEFAESTDGGVDGGGGGEAGLGGASAVAGDDGAQEAWALVSEEVGCHLIRRRRRSAARRAAFETWVRPWVVC